MTVYEELHGGSKVSELCGSNISVQGSYYQLLTTYTYYIYWHSSPRWKCYRYFLAVVIQPCPLLVDFGMAAKNTDKKLSPILVYTQTSF